MRASGVKPPGRGVRGRGKQLTRGSTGHLLEELGSVLMKVVFHADMEGEASGHFDLMIAATASAKAHSAPSVLLFRRCFGTKILTKFSPTGSTIKRAEKTGHGCRLTELEAVAKSAFFFGAPRKSKRKPQRSGLTGRTWAAQWTSSMRSSRNWKRAAKGAPAQRRAGRPAFFAVNAARFFKNRPGRSAARGV